MDEQSGRAIPIFNIQYSSYMYGKTTNKTNQNNTNQSLRENEFFILTISLFTVVLIVVLPPTSSSLLQRTFHKKNKYNLNTII